MPILLHDQINFLSSGNHMSRRKGSTLTHGGRRIGARRPSIDTVKKIYKLEPRVVNAIKAIAKEQDRTESAIANEFLYVVAFQINRNELYSICRFCTGPPLSCPGDLAPPLPGSRLPCARLSLKSTPESSACHRR